MKILFLGDVVGRPGRRALSEHLPELKTLYSVDFVVANCENASGGLGVMPEAVVQLLESGVDVLTSGNHVWAKKQLYPVLDTEPRLLRPQNYPEGVPGRGVGVYETAGGEKIGVMNLLGRIFMEPVESPFVWAERCLEDLAAAECDTILVDFHAEATSEKIALGWFLDGRVSAVIGTHTHVQTSDARLLEKGTAYLTDAGMCGPRDSVLGLAREPILKRFLLQTPQRFEVAKGPVQLNGALIETDNRGRALSIELVQQLI